MLIGSTLGFSVTPLTQQLCVLFLRFVQFSLQHHVSLCIALALLSAIDLGCICVCSTTSIGRGCCRLWPLHARAFNHGHAATIHWLAIGSWFGLIGVRIATAVNARGLRLSTCWTHPRKCAQDGQQA